MLTPLPYSAGVRGGWRAAAEDPRGQDGAGRSWPRRQSDRHRLRWSGFWCGHWPVVPGDLHECVYKWLVVDGTVGHPNPPNLHLYPYPIPTRVTNPTLAASIPPANPNPSPNPAPPHPYPYDQPHPNSVPPHPYLYKQPHTNPGSPSPLPPNPPQPGLTLTPTTNPTLTPSPTITHLTPVPLRPQPHYRPDSCTLNVFGFPCFFFLFGRPRRKLPSKQWTPMCTWWELVPRLPATRPSSPSSSVNSERWAGGEQYLTLSFPSSKSTFSQHFKEK